MLLEKNAYFKMYQKAALINLLTLLLQLQLLMQMQLLQLIQRLLHPMDQQLQQLPRTRLQRTLSLRMTLLTRFRQE